MLRFVALLAVLLSAEFALGQPSGSDNAPSSALAPEPPALPDAPDLREQVIRLPSMATGTRLAPREEPGWFRIGVPDGWQVVADRASGRIAVFNQDRRGLHIWALLLPRTLGAQEAGSLFLSLAAQVAPQTRWAQPATGARGERVTAAAQGGEGEFARAAGLSVVNVDRVAIVFFSMASAPRGAFAQSRDLFAAILESFAPLPGRDGGGGGAAGTLAYQRWNDPSENAFWLDAPKGWTVQGGVARKSAVDVRSVVQARNPDGSILIQFGDAEIPPFVEPWGWLQEGQQNGPALVRRYTPGAAFGRDYVMWRLKSAMPDLAIEAMRPMPQLQQIIQQAYNHYAVPGVERRIDIGEVLFGGTWNGRRARGHLYAATTRVSVQGGSAMWFAGDIASLQGFVAAQDQIATAVEAMNRMRESFEINPQWFGAQQQTTAAVSRITTETNRYISDLITRTYAGTQRTYERIFERYSRSQRGVVHVVDPQTQTRYEVQAGSNYYWITDRGVIAGTNTHFNPDPLWFRQMLTVVP